jgi:sugar phosphate isomerase/epimerase
MFLDTKRFKHRVLTFDEMVASMKRDIDFAAALGCPRLRVIVITPPEVTEACAAYAEQKDVCLLLEIHAPWNFQHEWIIQHIDMIERVGTPYVGLMPDFGIFCRRFPRIITDRYVRDGATRKLADHVVEVYDAKGDLAALPGDISKLGGTPKDIEFANYAGRYCDVPPREMLDYMPMIQHIQAKFYEMLDDGTEYSVPYPELVAVLQEGGYDGYLSSEYEGNRHLHDIFPVDSVDQVRRHHDMLKRLLGEGETAHV